MQMTSYTSSSSTVGAAIRQRPRVRFPDLQPDEFQHPWDVAALQVLKKMRGFDILIRKLSEFHLERIVYITSISNSIRVGPRQCKKIYDMLVEACHTLDVPVLPLYLTQSPIVNAYTTGMEQPSITIFTELVDLLTDDELLCVIAHEVGHIKCGHVLYKTMARVATAAAAIVSQNTFGLGRLVSAGLMAALEEWDRKSELSSDRAGLLVVQDVEVSIRVLMKLSGGCHAVVNQMDRDEFLKQAELYEALDESLVNWIYKFMLEQGATHPFPPLRAREIKDWSESAAYRELLDKYAAAGHVGYYRGKALTSEVGAEQARKGYQRGKALPPRDGGNQKSEG
jgi:Zn-dependent protease with chaperone function